ncbi:STAS domain-containing protein [Labedaea rhizosphaerae]|uniref:STAS domain-containing protein n=1 Tax=Labedaea rhizosphaerae TaxID=598644 RepID=UPI00105C150A|nr:STAS domain-containing protein [Labedaea rhizosphaerae]
MRKSVIRPAWDAGTPAVRVSRHRSDMTVVTVTGALDQPTVRALERVLRQDRTPRLIVDLSAVPELTPAAAGTISRAHARARAEQRRFSVVVPQRAAAKVLAATHAGPQLMRFLTLSDAMRETPPVLLR